MTPAERLRELAAAATPGPWEASTSGTFYAAELRAPSPYNGLALIKVMTNPDADLALITLAPELARWAADAASELEWFAAAGDRDSVSTRTAARLLLRLDDIVGDAA